MTAGRQFKTELQIFSERSCRKVRVCNNLPWKSHSRAHQLARQAQGTEPERANPVLHPPGEFADPGTLCRVWTTNHQIKSLDGPVCFLTDLRQAIDCEVRQRAIRIDYDDNLGGIVG